MKTSKSNFASKIKNRSGNDPKLKPIHPAQNSGIKSDKVVKKVLLMGYNGANNTGSETRLISIIEDVRNVLGPEVCITIPTLNEKNLRRYIKEDSRLIIAPVPSIYFFTLNRLVKEQDLVLLVEGSCYMDTWTSALLWAFLWTTRCANSYKIPCIAYAVDAGDLSSLNQFLVKREASKTDLIITRTSYAGEKLKEIGVTAPIKHTADSAFTFQPETDDYDILQKIWEREVLPEPSKGFVGLAIIDFYLWPVVIRPWGPKENLYKWPYYFSRSNTRIQGSNDLAAKWAAEADRIVENHGRNIALICMEELDEPLARNILNKMKNPQNTRIFSSSEFNASQMTEILRNLDLLVTSRYHAAVLSLEARIPQIAVGHDPRLKGLYKDLEIDNDYLIDYKPGKNADLKIWNKLSRSVDELLEDPAKIHEKLNNGFIEHLSRSIQNPLLLKEFLIDREWDV
jgi:polysaccharide pyruvyl transferase WcaK-like protein